MLEPSLSCSDELPQELLQRYKIMIFWSEFPQSCSKLKLSFFHVSATLKVLFIVVIVFVFYCYCYYCYCFFSNYIPLPSQFSILPDL